MPSPISLPARCGIAILSGAAYALAFPPLGWRWLVVPGVAGLLLSLQGLRGAQARGIGFLHGMAAYAVGVPWMWLLFGVQAVALWAILAAFTVAFAAMQGRAEARGWSGWKLGAFTLLNWGGWEFIRAELFPLKFPWMTAGLAWGPNKLLPWVGVYASGLVLVFLAICLTRRRWGTVVGTSLFVFVLGSLPEKWASEGGEPGEIRVAGLQYEDATLATLLKETRGLGPGIQHVVWPEYSLPYDVRANQKDWAALQALCRERRIALTVGTQTRRKDGGGWFNTALTLDANGTLGEHYKVHPVHFFDDGTPGTAALPVTTPLGKIGTPVCFDCDYEGVMRRMTAAGAEAFIIPMMDAISWGRWQHDQHAELFRIRACENARWLFVCGTSGVSQVIDAWGHPAGSRLEAMAQGDLTGYIRRESRLTFYTRWGWLTPWCLLGAASVCWIVLLLPPRAAKDSPS